MIPVAIMTTRKGQTYTLLLASMTIATLAMARDWWALNYENYTCEFASPPVQNPEQFALHARDPANFRRLGFIGMPMVQSEPCFSLYLRRAAR
jgi:hypothetical protein